jgi:hypothetical protein
VVGPPRSGTTLIYSLIAGEAFSPECTFVSTLMKVFDETYRFGDEERFEYYGHTLANLVEIFKKPIYDLLYTAAFKVGGVSTHRFVYKDPMLTLYLDYFPLFFGDSYKVVFCVRDPRDTVASMFNVLKKKNSGADADALFEEAIDFIFPFFRTVYQLEEAAVDIDRDKLIFIKYEDLATGNPETVQALENFLEMSIDPNGIREGIKDRLDENSPFYSENYGKPITTSPIGRYKDSLAFEQIVRVEHLFSYYMDRLGYERISEPGYSRFEPLKRQQQISSLQGELQKSRQQMFSLQLEQQKSQKEISGLRLELEKRQQRISSLKENLKETHDEISSLQAELQKSQQETSRLSSTLLRMPLVEEEPTIERAEHSLQTLNEYYRSEELPEIIQLFGPASKMTAHLVLANLYLRRGRYRTALSHFLKIARIDPLGFLSIQTVKIIGDGLMVSLKRSQSG